MDPAGRGQGTGRKTQIIRAEKKGAFFGEDPLVIGRRIWKKNVRAEKKVDLPQSCLYFWKSVIVFQRVSPNRFICFHVLRSAKPYFHIFKQLQTGQPITLVFPVLKVRADYININRSAGCRARLLLNTVDGLDNCVQ
jgi:hypothetical protein